MASRPVSVGQPRSPTTASSSPNKPTGESMSRSASLDSQQQHRQPLLHIRVLSFERRSRDLTVRFDARTNIGAYRQSYYQPFTRTYAELAFFVLSLSVHVPTHILAALPLPTPGLVAHNNIAEGRLLCYMLSRWFARLTNEPAHRDHPETRNFVETDYSYHPIPPNEEYAPPLVTKRWHAVMTQAVQEAKASLAVSIDVVGPGLGLPHGVFASNSNSQSVSRSGFLGFVGNKGSSITRSPSTSSAIGGKGMSLSRNVRDDDEDLVAARMEVTRLELQFSDAAQKGNALVAARSGVTTQLHSLSNRLHPLAGVESTRPLAASMKLPDDLKTLADGIVRVNVAQQAISQTELLTVLYQFAYQANNARSAKEALLARNALVEENFEASKRALVKKREIESLKVRMGSHSGNGAMTRDRIELAIQDFHEASTYAAHLKAVLDRMGAKLHESLRHHSRNAHSDLKQALKEHARGSVFHIRKEISELRKLRARLRGEKVAEDVVERTQTTNDVRQDERGSATLVLPSTADATSTLASAQAGPSMPSSISTLQSQAPAAASTLPQNGTDKAAVPRAESTEDEQTAFRGEDTRVPNNIEAKRHRAHQSQSVLLSSPQMSNAEEASHFGVEPDLRSAVSQSAFLPSAHTQPPSLRKDPFHSPYYYESHDHSVHRFTPQPTALRNGPSLANSSSRSPLVSPSSAGLVQRAPQQQTDVSASMNTSRFALSNWSAEALRNTKGDRAETGSAVHDSELPQTEFERAQGNTIVRRGGDFGYGASGAGSSRGRGRISASEAARTLAGRF